MFAEKKFKLKDNGTSVKIEVMAGFTTFFTMLYIIFINPSILSLAGMPKEGLIASTIISAVICTLIMAFFANSPFALAPGMGINTFVTYVMCLGLKYHWKEAMAITFITGILHFIVVQTSFRENLIKAVPNGLKYATSAGIGFFITYIGLKNAGFIKYTSAKGDYLDMGGIIISNSKIIPEFINILSIEHILAIFGLFLIIFILMIERKNKESYGAYLLGILIITFVGIPFGVTKINSSSFFELSFIFNLKDVIFSFFGNPGLLSLFSDPVKALTSVLMITILLLVCVIDGFVSIFSLSNINKSSIAGDYESKLNKSLMANSTSGIISALFGTSSCTTYIESATGVSVGGKTGLTSFIVAILFLLCLPFANFFGMIPLAAVAPVLIIAGIYLISLLKYIEWHNIEEAIPSALTMIFIPLTYNIINGVVFGFVAYIVISIANGKRKYIHPLIYLIVILFIAVIILRTILKI